MGSFLFTMMLLDVSRMDRCGKERRLGVIYAMKYKYKYKYIYIWMEIGMKSGRLWLIAPAGRLIPNVATLNYLNIYIYI